MARTDPNELYTCCESLWVSDGTPGGIFYDDGLTLRRGEIRSWSDRRWVLAGGGRRRGASAQAWPRLGARG